jgi:hypothetical protein
MKKVLVCVLGVLLAGSSVAKEVKGKSFVFTISDDVRCTQSDQMEMYTFKWGTPPEFCMFMLMANPVPVPEEAIPSMIEMMTISFKAQMQKQPGMKVTATEQKPIEAGLFKGSEVTFTIEHQAGTMKQNMLVLFDGDKVWNGQLTGMGSNDVTTVYSILKSAKK